MTRPRTSTLENIPLEDSDYQLAKSLFDFHKDNFTDSSAAYAGNRPRNVRFLNKILLKNGKPNKLPKGMADYIIRNLSGVQHENKPHNILFDALSLLIKYEALPKVEILSIALKDLIRSFTYSAIFDFTPTWTQERAQYIVKAIYPKGINLTQQEIISLFIEGSMSTDSGILKNPHAALLDEINDKHFLQTWDHLTRIDRHLRIGGPKAFKKDITLDFVAELDNPQPQLHKSIELTAHLLRTLIIDAYVTFEDKAELANKLIASAMFKESPSIIHAVYDWLPEYDVFDPVTGLMSNQNSLEMVILKSPEITYEMRQKRTLQDHCEDFEKRFSKLEPYFFKLQAKSVYNAVADSPVNVSSFQI